MIQAKNIKFSYRQQQILQQVEFSLPPGIFASIVGPNGSGKTTFLRLLTRERQDFQGELSLFGKPLANYSLASLAQTVSTVAQNLQIRFPFSCLDLVLLGRRPYNSGVLSKNSAADLEIVYQAMRDTETLQYADRLITELSGGERQRIFLAKALAQQPKLLILDESFANMDMYYSLQCLDILKQKVQKQELSVLSVMHDLNLVKQYSDQVVMFSQGKIFTYGQCNQVMTVENIKQVFNIDVLPVGENALAVIPPRRV